jgi:hypothetical protein
MKKPVVVVGIGELGAVFSHGFLRTGHPVYPILRGMDLSKEGREIPDLALALVAVGEADLGSVLGAIPDGWRERLALLQNELLPRDWNAHGLLNPTVIVVWFTKKKGIATTPSFASPVYGPQTNLVEEALNAIDIPTRRVDSPQEILLELVHKNVHILAMNITGLATGAMVEDLIDKHMPVTKEVAGEVIDLQEWLVGSPLPRQRLMERLWETLAAEPAGPATGRTAPDRLRRSIRYADEAGLPIPRLREIFAAAGR